MRRLFLFSILILFSSLSHSQNIKFHDIRFKRCLNTSLGQATSSDITVEQANNFKGKIRCSKKIITDTEGLQYFTRVREIDLSLNKLKTIDLSHNQDLVKLDIHNNLALSSLNVSNHEYLEEIDASHNSISDIYLNALTSLEVLDISYNGLTSINPFDNKFLKRLYCSNNQITDIGTYGNLDLEYLNCSHNPIINDLIVTHNTKLKSVDISSTKIRDWTLNDNLKRFKCSDNKFTSVGFSHNKLEELDCSGNKLKHINLSNWPNLKIFHCENNEFRTLSMQFFPDIKQLYCSGNKLKYLDIRNTEYGLLDATDNPLSKVLVDENFWILGAIDVGGAEFTTNCYQYITDKKFEQALIDINVDHGTIDKYIDSIDYTTTTVLGLAEKGISDFSGIEHFINLETLDCHSNQLTSIDLAKNVKLTGLACGGNQLTNLDVRWNQALELLYCQSNQLTSLDLNSSPAITGVVCGGNLLTDLKIQGATNLEQLSCTQNNLTQLNISNNAKLAGLDCSKNNLTGLITSSNSMLSTIWCNDNVMTSLDVSDNLALKDLRFYNNFLTGIDLETNTSLQTLACGGNHIVSLDISKNEALTKFACNDNLLTFLNIANGNNANMSIMNVVNNPSLTCIKVDNGSIPPSGKDWKKDDTASYNIDCTVGNEDLKEIDFALYPNPVSDELIIQTTSRILQVNIYSIAGSLISKYERQARIDVSNIPKGIHFVEVISEDGRGKQKLVKL